MTSDWNNLLFFREADLGGDFSTETLEPLLRLDCGPITHPDLADALMPTGILTGHSEGEPCVQLRFRSGDLNLLEMTAADPAGHRASFDRAHRDVTVAAELLGSAAGDMRTGALVGPVECSLTVAIESALRHLADDKSLLSHVVDGLAGVRYVEPEPEAQATWRVTVEFDSAAVDADPETLRHEAAEELRASNPSMTIERMD